jgi:hypothetical protein
MSKRKRPPVEPPAQPSLSNAAPFERMSTPILAEALRSLAAVRPSADVLLNAAADRLDAYAKMVELGSVITSGHEVVTHEIDLTGVAHERIQAAIGAATAALLPHSQDARKAAMAGLQADALATHRRQIAARHARLAKALRANPARSRTRKAAK